MAIPGLYPRQPDPYINFPGDQELAKFGHLRWLIRQINALPIGGLPDQTGHGGQYLTTDGTTASWVTITSGGYWTLNAGNLYPTTLSNNVGIGKVPTVKLDVLGDARIANSNYTSGLLFITETPAPFGTGAANVNLGDWNNNVNKTAFQIHDPAQRIALGVTVPATVPTGTAGLYMGESTGFSYAGFTADFGTDDKDHGNFTIGRFSGGGTFFQVSDDTAAGDSGAIGGAFQYLGGFAVSARGIGGVGFTGSTLSLNSFGTFFVGLSGTQGFGVDLSGGTGTGIYTMGNSTNTNIVINDTSHTINLQSVSITVNGAPTYTGTVAGAAGLNVVNGLIMN